VSPKGRNRTGPPCSVGRLTAHAPGGGPPDDKKLFISPQGLNTNWHPRLEREIPLSQKMIPGIKF